MASKKKLTDKEKQFVHYYILKGNASKAAKMAGYVSSTRNWNWIGYELLRKPHIKAYKEQKLADLEHDQEQMRWETIETARRCANGDPYTVGDWNPSGITLRNPEDIDEFDRRILKKVDIKEDNTGVHQKFEIEAKHPFMDYLAKVYGWYKDPKLVVSGELGPCLTIFNRDGTPKEQITLGEPEHANRQPDTDNGETPDHSGDREQLED